MLEQMQGYTDDETQMVISFTLKDARKKFSFGFAISTFVMPRIPSVFYSSLMAIKALPLRTCLPTESLQILWITHESCFCLCPL